MLLILRFLFRRRAIDMQPLRGNVLSTVYCRTGLWQRLLKLIIFFSSFPWDFCLFCVFIPLFSRLSAWHVSNICWDQINLIHFVNGFFFYHRFLDQWCSLVQPIMFTRILAQWNFWKLGALPGIEARRGRKWKTVSKTNQIRLLHEYQCEEDLQTSGEPTEEPQSRERAANHSDKGMSLRATCKDRSIGWVWKIWARRSAVPLNFFGWMIHYPKYVTKFWNFGISLSLDFLTSTTNRFSSVVRPYSFEIHFVAKMMWGLGSIKAEILTDP